MTPAERQRRRRAKLAEIVRPEQVLADLSHAYNRAYATPQGDIRAGVAKLLKRWEKDAEQEARRWRERLRPPTKRKKR
jgi:hypothetical protein